MSVRVKKKKRAKPMRSNTQKKSKKKGVGAHP